MRKRKPDENAGSVTKSWLLPFNDLITLLLTFFVLILSLSSLQTDKIAALSEALKDYMKVPEKDRPRVTIFQPFVTPTFDREIEAEIKRKEEEAARDELSAEIPSKVSSFAEKMSELSGIKARILDGNVYLSLDESLLFASGSAAVRGRENQVLLSMTKKIKETGAKIQVEGHTDNIPTAGLFPTNWELSTARAVNLVKYFIEQGGIDPEKLSAAGFADTKPVALNDSEAGRALNRRVELQIIFKEK